MEQKTQTQTLFKGRIRKLRFKAIYKTTSDGNKKNTEGNNSKSIFIATTYTFYSQECICGVPLGLLNRFLPQKLKLDLKISSLSKYEIKQI